MKIPEVAVRIRQIAEQIERYDPILAKELLTLADELKRRPPSVRSTVTSSHITPKLISEIQQFSEENPLLSYQTIAKKFNVNPGRVSEALRGKRQ
jgi:hypothetical protein